MVGRLRNVGISLSKRGVLAPWSTCRSGGARGSGHRLFRALL